MKKVTELNVQEMKTINGGGKSSAVMGGAGLAHTTLYGVAYYAGSLLC